ncbi:MAG TPA: hypothetical protein DCM62_02560 [Bacteroidales bacterium]|nr:hypothetical protein [Bacteroidales bacterium]
MFGLKKLDLYIIRKFLGTFFFTMLLIIFIVIIFDFSERIDDFIERQAPFREIVFDYYLNFIPFFVNLFSPLFLFITVIFFTARLAQNTEIVAILSSGISFNRMLLPYIIPALIIGVMSSGLANFVIPPANRIRLEFESKYFRAPETFWGRNIHLQINPGEFVFMESYNQPTATGFRFTLEKIEEGRLVYKMNAETARWDSITGVWSLLNYNIRQISGIEETLTFGAKRDTILPFSPNDFIQNLRKIETLGFTELHNFIDRLRRKGAENVEFYQVEMYQRLLFPASALILTLIGVSLSNRKVRGGIGLHLGLGLGLSFAYILFMQVTTTFATKGNLHPMIAVWIPNIFFGIIGYALYRLSPK